MAATVISNTVAFGSMTNQTIARLISTNTALARLNEAVTTASSGFTGVAGTQFEAGSTPPNLFGVQPDPATPGQKGQDYSYAIAELQTAWNTFWTAALPYIEQLDNGALAM